jgi:hypothetical protein
MCDTDGEFVKKRSQPVGLLPSRPHKGGVRRFCGVQDAFLEINRSLLSRKLRGLFLCIDIFLLTNWRKFLDCELCDNTKMKRNSLNEVTHSNSSYALKQTEEYLVN